MKTIGLLGGMGSYATCDIFRRILNAFPASKEWDRPRIIIDNNCTMPSRVRAILYGENKKRLIEDMSNSIENLISSGADIIMIGCMTAHYFRDELPYHDKIINILEITNTFLSNKIPKNSDILCLCTEGSLQTRIWSDALIDYNIIYPDEDGIKKLREFIEIVKQNKVDKNTVSDFTEYINKQSSMCEAALLGCTELPLLLDNYSENVKCNIIDPISCAIDYLKECI